MSANTKELIEEEVKSFIQQGYDTAFKILTKKKKEWDRLAVGLLEYETLTGEEIKKVMNGIRHFLMMKTKTMEVHQHLPLPLFQKQSPNPNLVGLWSQSLAKQSI